MSQEATPVAKKAKTEDMDDSAAGGSSTVFIKNLPWSATDDDLAAFFSDCGEIAEIRIGVHSTQYELHPYQLHHECVPIIFVNCLCC